jgi:hypothetical protein
MNAAVGVRTPAAALVEAGRARAPRTLLSRFMYALRESRRREACLVIARHAHLLPLDHPWRNGWHGGYP